MTEAEDHDATIGSDFLKAAYDVRCSCGFTADDLASFEDARVALEDHRIAAG